MTALTRLTILLPMRGTAQRKAAFQALADIKDRFGDNGGTWVATEAFDPVVAGWWESPTSRAKRLRAIEEGASESEARRDFPLIEDPHVLVTIDVPATPAHEDRAISILLNLFVSHYRGRGIGQRVVYVARQPVTVRSLPGRSRKRPLPAAPTP